MLFSGTLRANLDPFEAYSDSEVWDALEQASLGPTVRYLVQGVGIVLHTTERSLDLLERNPCSLNELSTLFLPNASDTHFVEALGNVHIAVLPLSATSWTRNYEYVEGRAVNSRQEARPTSSYTDF